MGMLMRRHLDTEATGDPQPSAISAKGGQDTHAQSASEADSVNEPVKAEPKTAKKRKA